ncbi:MAG TPA: TetR/AcrR family transcriptional regulator [Rhizomicrobium sp.]|nr:TetR/AcrR family transcriptional regulator [Rhizomicrobium sp.]
MIAAARKVAELDDKRERLLDAALELFELRGFDGVAVPEIARMANVATGTIYRYFETKEALVNALYRRWKEAYNAAVLAPLEGEHSPREMFGIYWRRMAGFARANPRAMRFLDLHHHASYLDAESCRAHNAYRDAAAQFVLAARKAGAIRTMNPALVVALMWGASAGLVKFAHEGVLKFDERAAGEMEEMLWRAIASNDGETDDRYKKG